MVKENDNLWTVFIGRKNTLKNSDLYKQIVDVIEPIKKDVSRIRCLGLGSIDSLLPMYQLCLLSLIVDYFNENNTNNSNNNDDDNDDDERELTSNNSISVSLWDPIFTKADNSFIVDHLNYEIIEQDNINYNDSIIKKSTFFYLPHFPILELEKFLSDVQPMYLLSNNLLVYNDKFTDLKYFELYPNAARISKLISDTEKDLKVTTKDVSATSSDDGFQIVKKKNRKNKRINYIPPVVNYDFESAFFKSVTNVNITGGNNLTNSWSSAFTDLSFYTIISK